MRVFGIIVGVLTALLGIYALAVPFRVFMGIGWIVGFLLLMTGIQMAAIAFKAEEKDVWRGILGILTAIAGIILLFSSASRFLTDVMFIYLIGGCVLAYGIFSIVVGSRTYQEAKGSSIFKIACGVLSVIVGVITFIHPTVAMISIGYLIACSLIVQGINTAVLSAKS